ncbi:MAG TPA: hypothetical protein VMC08_07450 [Bacteroidales bacterium]|nr:hypothetical protein [Bacteroidales bacterium]
MEITAPPNPLYSLPPFILLWFRDHPVMLKISRSRSSKLGDYRAPSAGHPARITVNPDLNRYEFLVTLVHEMAHHEVWKEARKGFFARHRRIPPHGVAWKNHYSRLMQPLLVPAFFPPDMLEVLTAYFRNPKASSKTESGLVRLLKKYDPPDGNEFLESLPFDALFRIPGGRSFRKKEKLRKRYRCVSLDNRKIYLLSPLVRVTRL